MARCPRSGLTGWFWLQAVNSVAVKLLVVTGVSSASKLTQVTVGRPQKICFQPPSLV